MNESMTPMKCCHCLFPIHVGESGLRYFGTGTAHTEARCIALLRQEIAAARARAEKAEAELERLSCAIHHAHKLAAALAQMPTAIEQHEREFLSRARVMDAVFTWRRSNDAAIEQEKKG